MPTHLHETVLDMAKRRRTKRVPAPTGPPGPFVTWRERVLLLFMLQLQSLLQRIIAELQANVPAVVPHVENDDDYEGFSPV